MRKNHLGGFTLMELVIVIALIAILATLAYPAYTYTQERAKAANDLNNLRQIGLATQMYMNDHDGALFSPSDSWMQDLRPTNTSQYLPNWRIFQSPFDPRGLSEDNVNAPISYGIDANAKNGGAPLTADQIKNPSVFIFFAPAMASSSTCSAKAFQGQSGTGAPGVTVLGLGSNNAQSNPGGTFSIGTHSSCQRINACMADLHVENMPFSTFADNGTGGSTDKTAPQRWNPTATPAP
jgi:prepilin-type N-terminal cleavage/methylation domain-containing protein